MALAKRQGYGLNCFGISLRGQPTYSVKRSALNHRVQSWQQGNPEYRPDILGAGNLQRLLMRGGSKKVQKSEGLVVMTGISVET